MGGGGEVGGLKWQVPEDCFSTDQRKWDRGVKVQSLPCRARQDQMHQAGVGPCTWPTWFGVLWGSAHKAAFLLWLHFIQVLLKSLGDP